MCRDMWESICKENVFLLHCTSSNSLTRCVTVLCYHMTALTNHISLRSLPQSSHMHAHPFSRFFHSQKVKTQTKTFISVCLPSSWCHRTWRALSCFFEYWTPSSWVCRSWRMTRTNTKTLGVPLTWWDNRIHLPLAPPLSAYITSPPPTDHGMLMLA